MSVYRFGAERADQGCARSPASGACDADHRPDHGLDHRRLRALVEAASELARLHGIMARTSRRIELQAALGCTLFCMLALVLDLALEAGAIPSGVPAAIVQALALAGPLAVAARSAAQGGPCPESRAASAAARALCIADLGARLEALAWTDAPPGRDGTPAHRPLEALLACAEGDLAALHAAAGGGAGRGGDVPR